MTDNLSFDSLHPYTAWLHLYPFNDYHSTKNGIGLYYIQVSTVVLRDLFGVIGI